MSNIYTNTYIVKITRLGWTHAIQVTGEWYYVQFSSSSVCYFLNRSFAAILVETPDPPPCPCTLGRLNVETCPIWNCFFPAVWRVRQRPLAAHHSYVSMQGYSA